MLRLITTSIFLLLAPLQISVIANEQPETDTEDIGNYQVHNEEVDQLAKLLEIPEVAKIKESCESSSRTDISECIWEKVEADEAIKNKVQAEMDATLNQVDGINQYESVTPIALKTKQTKSLKALEEFYAKKISKEIFGDDPSANGKVKILDHSKFNKMYENQITKNILSAVSSYCIDAENIKNYPLIYKDKKEVEKVRKYNLDALSNTQLQTDADGNPLTEAEIQSKSWSICLKNLQHVCHDEYREIDPVTKKATRGGLLKKELENTDSRIPKMPKYTKEDIEHSSKRACEVTNYLKVAKQNLKAAGKISEGYEALAKDGSYSVQGTDAKKNTIVEKVILNKEKLENITTTSSNEFAAESGFSKEVSADLAEFEKCLVKTVDPDTGNVKYAFSPGAQETCKKYLNTNKAEVEKLKEEHALRQKSLISKVNKLKNSNNEEDIKEFLIDQGRSEEEIQKQLQTTDIDALKEQITRRYEAEKEQLIESLNDKLDAQTSQKEGVINISDQSGNTDLEKLKKIHSELSAKTENYAQLIHYNNIVTGFLEIKDSDGKVVGRNTSSIQKELGGNAFSEKNIQAISVKNEAAYTGKAQALDESIQKANINLEGSSSSSEESSTTIGIKKINDDILNYDFDTNTP
ncbi:hypothetical protein [Halobacteriovorax sp. HLS]|uniref:hypothetical protein n=1 Tax=Halobacteriovorax sp. HLS TaxID=2234000 RepID=UPI000FD914E0|nr:hypothetical protein [Halobacteriovorax sp. HLS]